MIGNKIIFQKLTPIDNVDMKVYEEALNYVFENKDIKNVAISGPYSAGKSSLLESYKKKHNDKKFLHISLAHFNETKADEKDSNNEEFGNIETILEGKILNQLIQQLDARKIPQTNFHVKRTVSGWKCVWLSLGIVLFVLSLLHIKYFSSWTNWVNSLETTCIKKALVKFTDPYSVMITGILAIMLLFLGVWQVIVIQKNKNIFRKFSVQGNEIEIFAEDNNSYFDKYLNEVLYLFENSCVDVIVFEDIDRFDDNKIFERLREINILTNIRLKSKMENGLDTLRFFYLIRDDIFINKDRTKFFDYILPVIPVLDSSNAYDQLKKHFEEAGLFNLFSERFLRGLSLYIDDMRVLKNIYNEFMVYFHKLNDIELVADKMLALVTYKNIFPRDFVDLQLNKGFVYELFNQKEKFIVDEKSLCEEKIEYKKKQIEYVKKEKLESIAELDDVKVAKINRDRYSYSEWVKREYPLRKQAIEYKCNSCLSELELELQLLQDEYNLIESKPLHQIITRENIDILFAVSYTNEIGEINKYTDIKGSEYFSLLKFLIRNGYIDETYNDYLTFFYENSLSKRDKMFLRSVTDKKAKEYTYPLENVELVFSNLDIADFEQTETQNFDLFTYLLKNNKEKPLHCFIRHLKKDKNINFIGEFFALDREIQNLVVQVNDVWPEFFEKALIEKRLSNQQLRDYSIATLEFMETEKLSTVNINGCLTNYISAQPDYLVMKEPNVEKICDAFKCLKVRFVRIDHYKGHVSLFHEVYKNSLYQLNIDNIKLMLQEEYCIVNIDQKLENCASIIFRRKEQPLYKYIQDNMNLFIECMLNTPIERFTDDSDVAVELINNAEISEENKIAYIEKLDTKIESIEDIKDVKYQTEIIARMGVIYTAKNIIEYFNRTGLTENLIKFINSVDKEVNYAYVENQDAVKKFWDKCISCVDLSAKKYSEILMSISPTYSEFGITGIPKDKMEILIKNGVIPMTQNTLKFMRTNYGSLKMQYIKSKLVDYAVVAIGSFTDVEEVKEILLWEVSPDIRKNPFKCKGKIICYQSKLFG